MTAMLFGDRALLYDIGWLATRVFSPVCLVYHLKPPALPSQGLGWQEGTAVPAHVLVLTSNIPRTHNTPWLTKYAVSHVAVVSDTCDSSTQRAEIGGSQVQDQPELRN